MSRTYRIDIPFVFVVNNDDRDLLRLMEWFLNTRKDERDYKWDYEMVGFRYVEHYDGELMDAFFKEWFDMPGNYGFDSDGTDERFLLLEFRLTVGDEEVDQ